MEAPTSSKQKAIADLVSWETLSEGAVRLTARSATIAEMPQTDERFERRMDEWQAWLEGWTRDHSEELAARAAADEAADEARRAARAAAPKTKVRASVRYLDDWADRCAAWVEVRRVGRSSVAEVELTVEELADLRSDAEFYGDPSMADGFDPGLKSLCRAAAGLARRFAEGKVA